MAVAALALVGVLALTTQLARQDPLAGWRASLLRASVWCGAFTVAVTETLSAFAALTPIAIQAAWVIVSATCIAAALFHTGRRPPRFPIQVPERRLEFACLGLTGITLLVALVICLVSPSNATDAQIYHLPRMMQWHQNQTIAFFPTNIIRQVHTSPFAEYAALQSIELAGADRLVNLVQWFSLVGCAIGSSLIARQLGAGRIGQALAAFAAVSVPTAIVQVAGGKNDIVASFWCVSVISLLLGLRARLSSLSSAEVGLSLGFALLTKPSTGLLLLVPASLLMADLGFRHRARPARLTASAALIAVLTVLPVAPHALRNHAVFGSPLGPAQDGPTADFTYMMPGFSAQALVSNLLRNTAYELGTPWEAVNSAMFTAVVQAHELLGIELNERRATWPIGEFTTPRTHPQDEWAPNPVHTLLIIVVGAIAAPLAWRTLEPRSRAYVLGLMTSYVLVCASLRWQWSNVRYLLPLMVMWMPLVGLIADRLPKTVIAVLIAALAYGIAPAFTENSPRQILGDQTIFTEPRLTLYAAQRPQFLRVFRQAVDQLRDQPCRDVGIILDWDDFEYPLWALLRDANVGQFTLGHVQVGNATGSLRQPGPRAFRPCLLVSDRVNPTDTVAVGDQLFDAAWLGQSVTLYRAHGEALPVRLPYSVVYVSNPPVQWAPGQRQEYEVQLTDTGSQAWPSDGSIVLGVQFGLESDEPYVDWATDQRIRLPRDVAAGETIAIPVQIQAPEKEGAYVLRHRLFKEGTFWFSQIQKTDVTVARPAPGGRRGRS